MRRLARSILLATLLLAFAGVAGAQEAPPEHVAEPGAEHGGHGEHGIDLKTLALQFLNFGVLAFILAKFGGGAINKVLRARHDQLKADIDEAARVRSAAEARFLEHQRRLDNLEQEVAAMRTAIQKEAEHEKVRIVAAAEEKATRIVAETRFQVDQQVKEAEVRFRAEVAAAAMKVAGDILRRSVTASDEQRLTQSFVGELAAVRPAEGGKGRPQPSEETVS